MYRCLPEGLLRGLDSLGIAGDLALRLLGKGLDTADADDDGEDDERHGEDELEPDGPVSAAGHDGVEPLGNGDDQRGQGSDHHEDHGDEEHLVALADVAEPAGDGHESQAGEELVGGARGSSRWRQG